MTPVTAELVASRAAASHILEGLRRLRTRARNELAFLSGDRAHGGPERTDDRGALASLIADLDTEITHRAAGREWRGR